MIVECSDEVRVLHSGNEYLFEEKHLFGYTYDVPDGLGKAAVATGKCHEVKGYKGPTEEPVRHPVIV